MKETHLRIPAQGLQGQWARGWDPLILWTQRLQYPCRGPTTCQAALGRRDPRQQEGAPQPPLVSQGENVFFVITNLVVTPNQRQETCAEVRFGPESRVWGWERCRQCLGSTSLLKQGLLPLPGPLGECVYRCAYLHDSGEKQVPKACVAPGREEPLSSPWGGIWL